MSKLRTLRELIRETRLEFPRPDGGIGLSIAELAERAGISPTTLQGLETGRTAPSPLTVKRLAKALRLLDKIKV